MLAVYERGEVGLEGAPAAVLLLAPLRRPRLPRTLLDSVGDGDRRAPARDEHEKPARGHAGELEHPNGHRIEAVKIVNQPAVEIGTFERRL